MSKAKAPFYLHDQRFQSAEKFLQFLLTCKNFQPRRTLETIGTGLRGFIFRGHSDWNWELIPSAHRNGVRSKLWEYCPQPKPRGTFPDEKAKRDALGTWIFEELHAVQRFLETADKIGLPTPLDYHHFDVHRQFFEDLWKGGEDVHTRPFPGGELLSAIAFAQHHGVPTRIRRAPISGTQFLNATASVRAQLHGSNGACYETAFTPAEVIKNDGRQFKAKF